MRRIGFAKENLVIVRNGENGEYVWVGKQRMSPLSLQVGRQRQERALVLNSILWPICVSQGTKLLEDSIKR